jgi:hypothetical protein
MNRPTAVDARAAEEGNPYLAWKPCWVLMISSNSFHGFLAYSSEIMGRYLSHSSADGPVVAPHLSDCLELDVLAGCRLVGDMVLDRR